MWRRRRRLGGGVACARGQSPRSQHARHQRDGVLRPLFVVVPHAGGLPLRRPPLDHGVHWCRPSLLRDLLRLPPPGCSQVLFAKPEDPLAHLAALTAAKLRARNGAGFDTTEPDRLLAGVYSLPPDVGSAVSDSNETAPPSTSVAAVAPASAASIAERMLEASRAISSELDPVKAADSIVTHACKGERGNWPPP